jgi:hypothetical protein
MHANPDSCTPGYRLVISRPMKKPFPLCELHALLQHPGIRETLDNLEFGNKRSGYNPVFTPLQMSMKNTYFLRSRVGLTWRLHTGAFTIKVPTVILENGTRVYSAVALSRHVSWLKAMELVSKLKS